MLNISFKKILPHLIAIVIFIVVAAIYCKPALQGKTLQQSDVLHWKGMSQQSMEFKAKNGYYPLWTNSMFSGMPAYQIALDSKTHISVGYLGTILTLGLPEPMNYFFLACLCFYIFCMVAGANAWVSIMGAIAYAYSTFDPIIIAVGHNTQMLSIGFAPAIFAGLLLLFQKKYWVGFAVTALFSALLIGQNHVQIVYYTLITAGIFTIAWLIKSQKEGQIIPAIKSAALGLLAGIIGLACNAVSMMPTAEYAKETMRGGKSELTLQSDKGNKTQGGLDKDYAFRWSYGIGETFTLMVPGIYGGSNGGSELGTSSKFVEKLTEVGVPEDNALQMANGNAYWGEQPFTSGPVYLGAIICFLFIFGMVYLKSWHKWWIATAAILAILLAWGYNFKAFNYFLFDYLPFYNKFRAPSMSLFIPQLCFPFMAVLAVSQLVREQADNLLLWKKFKLSLYITGGLLALLAVFYMSAGFSGTNDKRLKESFQQSMLSQTPAGQQPSPQVMQQAQETSSAMLTALVSDRKTLMLTDLIRSIVLIGLAALLCGLFIKRKIGQTILFAGLILLSGYDLITVDRRYLSEKNYVDPSDNEATFTPTPAEQQILNDPNHANARVFNSTSDPFQDAITSYHFNSIGGYHPAKLGLYQDIIENQLSKNNMQVYNMLNAKYFIVQDPATGKAVTQINPGAFGNCWLVKGIKYVDNADQEMKALDSTHLKDTAVVNKKFQPAIKGNPQYDSTASITLKENNNDVITYAYKASTPQFAVFSEVYYDKGWNAYIDGQKTDYAKVDYVLRGLYIPAGSHEIVFRFEPSSFTTGRMISIWSTIITYLALIIGFVMYFRKRKESATTKEETLSSK